MQFRNDINGLRAIAVIAVVLFHFNASWLPGGFAGVDVFFVISGFLMTGIIFRGLVQENFSIMKFYLARANRIIPALAVLCLVLMIFGWFYLLPMDYKALGKHVASSMSFLSNVAYWRESGYFDASSHEKWLLHTWSLSAEWQFYMIYPVVLLAMRKLMSIKTIKAMVVIGTILGLAFSVVVTYKWPNPAYYLLPTRAWEMMIGGVAYLYPMSIKETRKKYLEWFAMTLIVGSYVFISKEYPWPGYLAIFPVFGAYLIIQAQRSDSVITGNKVFQLLGKWSYSIYLWHWPLVVAIYYFSLDESYVYLGIALSVLLGFLSNKYIEGFKFRNDYKSLFSYLKSKPVYMVLAVGFIGAGLFKTNGVESHYPTMLLTAEKEIHNRNPFKCMQGNLFPCVIGNKENIRVIIVGDSHADALTTALTSIFNNDKEGVIALTKSSCPFILDMYSRKSGNECLIENKRRLEYIQKHYKGTPVVWIARTGAYLYGQSNPDRVLDSSWLLPSIYFSKLRDVADDALHLELLNALDLTISIINETNPVYMVHPTPEMRKNIPKTISKDILFGRNSDLHINKELYFTRNNKVRNILSTVADNNNVVLLDPIPYLCDDSLCFGTNGDKPIFYDGDHMSEFGNKLLSPMFKKALR